MQQIKEKAQILKRVESLHESNPMLGLRGVRLGNQIPELTTMQVRAIFEAACMVTKEGIEVHPEIMIPLPRQRCLVEHRLSGSARPGVTHKIILRPVSGSQI